MNAKESSLTTIDEPSAESRQWTPQQLALLEMVHPQIHSECHLSIRSGLHSLLAITLFHSIVLNHDSSQTIACQESWRRRNRSIIDTLNTIGRQHDEKV